jgi:hypothetical protein
MKEPKDLRVKLGSVEEKFWTDIKKKSEDSILNARREIIINEAIIELAEIKIEDEKD